MKRFLFATSGMLGFLIAGATLLASARGAGAAIAYGTPEAAAALQFDPFHPAAAAASRQAPILVPNLRSIHVGARTSARGRRSRRRRFSLA